MEWGTGQCHQMTQRGGKGFDKVSRDILSKPLSHFLAFWTILKGFKNNIFGKIKMSHHTKGEGGTDPCH